MKKGIFFLTCCCFSFAMTVPVMAAGNRQHSETFDERVTNIKNRFPVGKYWQHTGENNLDSVLDRPICNKTRHTTQEMKTGSCGCNSYSGAIQCAGFAQYEAQIVFGTNVINQWIKHDNLNHDAGENISIGDYVRIPGHSLFIIDINGDDFTSYSCWGSQGSKIAVETFKKQMLNEQVEAFRHANNYDDIFKPSGSSNGTQIHQEGWDNTLGFWRYGLSNGTYATNQFIDLGRDKKYYFKDDTSLVCGDWHEVDGRWYYFAEDGHANLGWQQIGGKWYYFNDPAGDMKVNGWEKLKSDYYYLGGDGIMLTDEWIYSGNKQYYVGSDGVMYRNICATIDDIYYDFNNSGEAKIIDNASGEGNKEPSYVPPTNVQESNKVTQYSYRTRTKEYEYKTSNRDYLDGWEYVGEVKGSSDEWGTWSNWSSEYMESSDDIRVEKRTSNTGKKTQIYLGRYYSKSKNAYFPTKKDESYEFEGGWFDESNVTFKGEVFKGGRTDCYTIPGYGYYFFEIGEHGGKTREVSSGSQTEYRYREKLNSTQYKFRRYKYSNWSDWSLWSEIPITSDDLTDVRTRKN